MTRSLELSDFVRKAIGIDFPVFPKENFPPYNLYKKDGEMVVEMALAGYKKSDINISERENRLIIQGKTSKEEKDYVYKGISGKDFYTSYLLGKHHNVKEATMEDGVLKIVIVNNEPEPITKKIELK